MVFQYVRARDLTGRPSRDYLIDLGLVALNAATAKHPVIVQRLRDRVRPDRATNRDRWRRENWWLLGRPNRELRNALEGLASVICTPRTARHRFFCMLPGSIRADEGVVYVATSHRWQQAVLSSSLHVLWATAAGSRLGVGNDPRYNKNRCFDPFPFPDPMAEDLKEKIRAGAEELDATRKKVLADFVKPA